MFCLKLESISKGSWILMFRDLRRVLDSSIVVMISLGTIWIQLSGIFWKEKCCWSSLILKDKFIDWMIENEEPET